MIFFNENRFIHIFFVIFKYIQIRKISPIFITDISILNGYFVEDNGMINYRLKIGYKKEQKERHIF
jgi:hypothetical protein